MGTWGVGLFSNDLACDVRDMYRDYLAYGYEDALTEEKVIEYWVPQIEDSTDECAFWLALASTEHKYGRLSEQVKEKAYYYIDNDLELWNKDQKKRRKAVLEKLKNALSSPSARKRVSPICPQTTEWKKGDIVLARVEPQGSSEKILCALQVFDVLCVPYSDFLPDGPQNRIPVVGVYRWTGKRIPTIDELLDQGFVTSPYYSSKEGDIKPPYVFCMIVNKADKKKYEYLVIENNKEYLSVLDERSITSQIGSIWGSFESIVPLIKFPSD